MGAVAGLAGPRVDEHGDGLLVAIGHGVGRLDQRGDSYGNSTLASITRSWTLAAGDYTLVLGSDSSSVSSPPRQGYIASFTTAPEPSRAMLLVIAGAGTVMRRRRK